MLLSSVMLMETGLWEPRGDLWGDTPPLLGRGLPAGDTIVFTRMAGFWDIPINEYIIVHSQQKLSEIYCTLKWETVFTSALIYTHENWGYSWSPNLNIPVLRIWVIPTHLMGAPQLKGAKRKKIPFEYFTGTLVYSTACISNEFLKRNITVQNHYKYT